MAVEWDDSELSITFKSGAVTKLFAKTTYLLARIKRLTSPLIDDQFEIVEGWIATPLIVNRAIRVRPCDIALIELTEAVNAIYPIAPDDLGRVAAEGL